MKVLSAVCAALMFSFAGVASSETVLVQASYAEVGNGWLFGSRVDRSCWLAFPYHIIEDGGLADAAGVGFRDQSGRSGETGPPIHVTDIPRVEEAAGHDDLAFARVTVGRKTSECPSRLGLPPSGYIEALRSDSSLELTYVQEKSTVTFGVDALRHIVDERPGSLLLLRARNLSDAAFLQGGISGAVAELRWQGNLFPAAMILNVSKNQTGAPALRFDRIRAAFEEVEAYEIDSQERVTTKKKGIDFDITGLSANVAKGSSALGKLFNSDACWRAAPQPGERVVEIVLSVPEEAERISSIKLIADPTCGPQQSAIVETLGPGGGWTILTSACPIAPGGGRGCRVNRSAPLELRLRVVPQGGWLGLSRIIFE